MGKEQRNLKNHLKQNGRGEMSTSSPKILFQYFVTFPIDTCCKRYYIIFLNMIQGATPEANTFDL